MLLTKVPSRTQIFSRTASRREHASENRLHPLQISKTYHSALEEEPISWASLLSELSLGGQVLTKAIKLLRSGSKPNAHTLVHLARACANTGIFPNGEQLHTYILKSGFVSNTFVSTALVNLYLKFDQLYDACRVFDDIPEPSVVSWNSLISGYVHSGQFRKALDLFVQLVKSNICADSYSYTAGLSACGQLRIICIGRWVHSKIIKHGVESSVFVSNCLIDMYGKCGQVEEAMNVFRYMTWMDNFSWNSVIAANARKGKLETAFSLLCWMPYPDTISYNELISGTAQFGVLADAIRVLEETPSPNSSSWNSIITGFTNRGRAREAVECFCKMQSCGVLMDEFTFSSILSSVANLSAVVWGSLIHCSALKRGLDVYVVVGSALIDMYFKCGLVEQARSIFESLPQKNLVTWNIVMSGYAHNGHPEKVMEIFEGMRTTEILHPDEITFLNLLSACWHGRIPLEIANGYFDMMILDYKIHPLPEHCSVMIKMMGHEGVLNKAEKMIIEMGYGCCGVVWKSLLGVCAAYGDIEVAEVAGRKLIELEGENEFVYVTMSNIYALHGKWEDVGGVRKAMREKKVMKEAGSSWIQVHEDAILYQNSSATDD